MRTVGRLVAKPMLHIHAGLGALEDDMTVHYRHMTPTRTLRNYGCLRRSAGPIPPYGRVKNSTQFGFLPVA